MDEDEKAQAAAVQEQNKKQGASVFVDDQTTDTTPPGTLYGYGGGGGGSSRSPEDVQADTQAQIWNTQANYAQRRDDMDKMAQNQLDNFNRQMKANNDLLSQQNRQNMRAIEWQPNQQREQSTLMALRNRMGNAAYGSNLTDLREGLGRVDDMNDNALIQAWKQNADNAYSNWFQANAQLVSDYNDQVTALEDEFSKLYSQYWQAISNISPQLASPENMRAHNAYGKKQSEWKSPTTGEGTDFYSLNPIDLTPTDALRKMLVYKDQASAVNPLTKGYVRPDKGQTSYGKANGMYGRNAANKAFYDNLLAYSRPRI